MKNLILILTILITSLYSYGQKGILFTKKDNQKTKIIYENKRIKITLNNDLVLKGKFTIVNDSTIAIKDTLISLSSVVKIKKETKFEQIITPISLAYGGTLTIVGVAGLAAGGWSVLLGVFIPIGAPFIIIPLSKSNNSCLKWDYQIIDTNAPIDTIPKKEKKEPKIINNNPNPLD